MVFDYRALPREFKRRYLPPGLEFDWPALRKVFEELSSRPLGSVSELEKWLLDEAELDSFVYEQRTVRYINSTARPTTRTSRGRTKSTPSGWSRR